MTVLHVHEFSFIEKMFRFTNIGKECIKGQAEECSKCYRLKKQIESFHSRLLFDRYT